MNVRKEEFHSWTDGHNYLPWHLCRYSYKDRPNWMPQRIHRKCLNDSQIDNRKHFISQWWKLSNDWVKTVQKFLSNKNRSLERNCKRIASDHNRLLSKAFSFFLQLYVRFGGILFLIIYDLKLKKCLRWYLRLLQLPPKGIFSSTNAELVGQCVF